MSKKKIIHVYEFKDHPSWALFDKNKLIVYANDYDHDLDNYVMESVLTHVGISYKKLKKLNKKQFKVLRAYSSDFDEIGE